jgi:hypothetical protein
MLGCITERCLHTDHDAYVGDGRGWHVGVRAPLLHQHLAGPRLPLVLLRHHRWENPSKNAEDQGARSRDGHSLRPARRPGPPARDHGEEDAQLGLQGAHTRLHRDAFTCWRLSFETTKAFPVDGMQMYFCLSKMHGIVGVSLIEVRWRRCKSGKLS